MFLQLQSISVTISYDSSGNIDVHVPHTLVTSVCGMCSEEYVSIIVLIVCGMCSEEYVSTYCTYCMLPLSTTEPSASLTYRHIRTPCFVKPPICY